MILQGEMFVQSFEIQKVFQVRVRGNGVGIKRSACKSKSIYWCCVNALPSHSRLNSFLLHSVKSIDIRIQWWRRSFFRALFRHRSHSLTHSTIIFLLVNFEHETLRYFMIFNICSAYIHFISNMAIFEILVLESLFFSLLPPTPDTMTLRDCLPSLRNSLFIYVLQKSSWRCLFHCICSVLLLCGPLFFEKCLFQWAFFLSFDHAMQFKYLFKVKNEKERFLHEKVQFFLWSSRFEQVRENATRWFLKIYIFFTHRALFVVCRAENESVIKLQINSTEKQSHKVSSFSLWVPAWRWEIIHACQALERVPNNFSSLLLNFPVS